MDCFLKNKVGNDAGEGRHGLGHLFTQSPLLGEEEKSRKSWQDRGTDGRVCRPCSVEGAVLIVWGVRLLF